MTIEHAHRNLIEKLTPIFEKREATLMARIVFEDAFSITNFLRKDELSDLQIAQLQEIQTRLLTKEPCLLYTSPSPRDATLSRMPSSA